MDNSQNNGEMKRFEADANFIVYSAKKDAYTFHNYKNFTLEGYPFYNENNNFIRLPERILPKLSDNLQAIAHNSGGGAIRFCTNSKKLAVYAEYNEKWQCSNMSGKITTGFDLYKRIGEQYYSVAGFQALLDEEVLDMEYTISDDDEMYEYILYMPVFSWVKDFSIGVLNGSSIEDAPRRKNSRKILCYGSSVTHGACASRSGMTYPAILGRMLDCEVSNLGFSGNCKGEECIADEFAKLDIDLFVMEYAHNAPSKEHLAATHEPFYRIMRESHPDMKIVFITMPEFEYKTTQIEGDYKKIVKATYDKAVAEGDKNVFYLDGRAIFPDCMRADYSAGDRCHPSDLGMMEIAKAVCDVIK